MSRGIITSFEKIHRMSLQEINHRFEYLGEGISRIVYGINDHWVIKVAKGIEGIYQNKVELYVYRHAGKKYRKYLCPIIWHRPDMLVMPRAIPLSKLVRTRKIDLSKIREEKEAKEDLIKFSESFYLLFEDIESVSSWGMINNTPVLIDYGCTNEAGDRFYDSI